jgi:hypothetical protein
MYTRSGGEASSIGSATDLLNTELLTWDTHMLLLDLTGTAQQWSVDVDPEEEQYRPRGLVSLLGGPQEW